MLSSSISRFSPFAVHWMLFLCPPRCTLCSLISKVKCPHLKCVCGFRFCYEEGCTKEDPLSQEIIRKLADPLPFAKHIHSKLVCYITKEPMNDNNPPLVLPNGYVYSTKVCLGVFCFFIKLIRRIILIIPHLVLLM